MTIWSRFRSWLRATLWRSRLENEMDAELHFHIESYAEDLTRSGVPREEALRRARLAFGGLDRAKEECRDARGVNLVESLLQDVRYGLRMLAKNPGFTVVAVLTLALGIGATTAIFSVVDAVLLHPAPYVEAAQLVEISEKSPQGERDGVSVGDFTDWEEQTQAFQGVAAYRHWEFHTLTGAGQPDEVWVSPVSENLFQLLGVNAAFGRTFTASESQAVVLSLQYWRSHFSADPRLSVSPWRSMESRTRLLASRRLTSSFHEPTLKCGSH